jgi:hypothetical protein
MKKGLLLAAILCLGSFLYAQNISGIVRGTLKDPMNEPLPEATVSIMGIPDSSLVSFSLTTNSGYFEIKNIDGGSYYLLVSYQGFETIKKPFQITPLNTEINFNVVKMEKSYKTLSEVVVKDQPPIQVRGDTLAYNANLFKTKPNATVEELLKKLPGVQVEKDGTVKAQGENVQKVYVDGKEFFGNDPKLATKNLSADMIDQVEVFDDVSEQSKFNKIDDGSRTKAINLKLKKDKKKGTFGRASLAYGTDERYDAGLSANFFKGATQLSLIARANNTNNVGFTISDGMGMFGSGGFSGLGGMSGGGMMIARGSMGGGGGNFNGMGVGTGASGITKTGSAGINYRDVWSPKLDITGSYFYNHANAANRRLAYRETFFIDSTITNDRQTTSENNNNNHRINLNLTYAVDSLNSIIYQPNISFQNSASYRDDSLLQYALKGNTAYELNKTRTINDNKGNGVNWTNNLIWRRKLNKIGRTLSVNLSNTLNTSDRNGYTSSTGEFYNSGGQKVRDNSFRQHNLTDNATNNYGVSVSYTEPIARNKIWEFNYAYNKNQSESDRRTNNYNFATGAYDIENSSLTNHFKSINEWNRLGTNFRVMNKKYNYQLGIAVQKILLKSNDLTKDLSLQERYTNLFPTFRFDYNFARSRSLRLNYRGRTTQPSISQLQEVIDSTNFPTIRNGNAGLNQEFSNNVSLTYNFFDMIKFRNLFAVISFNNTSNKIVDEITNKGGGVQFIRPVNMDGIFNLTGAFNIGFPIKKMKGGNFNTNTRISYARNGNIVDGLNNYSNNLTVGEDLRLNYDYKDKLDVSVSTSINYTSARYTIKTPFNSNTSYFTHVYSTDLSYTFPQGFILSTDVDYTLNPEQGAGIDRDFTMWNASFARQFFKNKRGELKFTVYDLLDQNQSFNRTIGENYTEDVRNTALKRFFMLSFTYNLNRMAGRNMPGDGRRAREMMRH